MSLMNDFVSRTLKPFLIVFGLATCGTLPFAIDIELITPLLGGLVDYTPSSYHDPMRGAGARLTICGLRAYHSKVN